jgi:hypothetical protein
MTSFLTPEFVGVLHYVDYAAAICVLSLFIGGVIIEILNRIKS